MIGADRKNISKYKSRIISRINREIPKSWTHELDPNKIFPLCKRVLPNKITQRSRIALSRNCKFEAIDLVLRFRIVINGILHVGAHKGEEIPAYLRAGIDYAIFIEPLSANYSELKNMINNKPGYFAFKNAAGESNESVKIHLASNDLQSSSILKPHLHLDEAPDIHFAGVEEVEQLRIDSMEFERTPNFWVIDVQGYEMNVLRGAQNRILECDYLFIELNRGEVYENCTKVKELDNHLNELGFKRVLTRWWPLWGDGFYIRKAKLPLKQ